MDYIFCYWLDTEVLKYVDSSNIANLLFFVASLMFRNISCMCGSNFYVWLETDILRDYGMVADRLRGID